MENSKFNGNSDSAFVRLAIADDVHLLYSVCRESYVESFADHWQKGGLDWYLEKVYGMDALQRDLANPAINYFISYYDGQPAGFMKVKLNSPLSDTRKDTIEIEKLYFLTKYQRKGLGKLMIERAVRLSEDLGAGALWLSVIDTNSSAISFYENNGFTRFNKTRLEIPYFKDELRGMWRMVREQ